MIGHEVMTAIVTTSARERIPRVMQVQEARKKPELPVVIPSVENIFPHPIPAQEIGGYPAIMVEELETGPRYTTRQQAPSGAFDEYEFRYLFRVWSYVTGRDFKETGYRQKYLATAIRMAFLENKCLYSSESENAVIDPSTVRESFSNMDQDEDAQKYLAGSFFEFEIVAQETLRPSTFPDDLLAVFNLNVGLMERNSAEPIPPTITPVIVSE